MIKKAIYVNKQDLDVVKQVLTAKGTILEEKAISAQIQQIIFKPHTCLQQIEQIVKTTMFAEALSILDPLLNNEQKAK